MYTVYIHVFHSDIILNQIYCDKNNIDLITYTLQKMYIVYKQNYTIVKLKL